MVLQKANLKTFLSFFLVAAMLVTSVVIYGIRPSAEAAELPEGYVNLNGSFEDNNHDDYYSDTSSTTPEYTLGDVDQDGDITAIDALIVLKYSVDLIELSDEALLAAEVDGVEGVTASDALAILKKSVGLIDKFLSSWDVRSPDGKINAQFELDNGSLKYTAYYDRKMAIGSSDLGLSTSIGDFNTGLTYLSKSTRTITQEYPMYSGKASTYKDNSNEMTLVFKKGDLELSLVIRVADDSLSFKYLINNTEDFSIFSEKTSYAIPGDSDVISQPYNNHYENIFDKNKVENLSGDRCLTLTYQTPDGVSVLLSEANMGTNYCGSMLSPIKNNIVKYTFPPEQGQTPIYVKGAFESPWRVAVIGTLASIAECQTFENLSNESVVPPTDDDWVIPGVTTWTWLTGEGTNNSYVYKKYIDFNVEMGWKYVLMDEGWSVGDRANVTLPFWINDLVKYANERDIGLLAWLHMSSVDTPAKADSVLGMISKAGIKGVKLDFFDSENQWTMALFDQLLKTCNKYKLVVNLHGANKPTGERREYPFSFTREAVQGNEFYNAIAFQNCVLPLTRAAVGPSDYTPKLTSRNVTTNQMAALAVLLESGIPCFASSPSEYRESALYSWYKNMPSAWDETKLLDAKLGDYISMARRSGENWYVSSICDTKQNATIDFDFLEKNATYLATIYKDSDKRDISNIEVVEVKRGDRLTIPMNHAGGCNVKLIKAFSPEVKIKLNQESVTVIEGKKARITATVTGETKGIPVVWKSDNENIVTISGSNTATIIAKNEGRANISAVFGIGSKAITVKCEVIVKVGPYKLSNVWNLGNQDKTLYNIDSESKMTIVSTVGDIYPPNTIFTNMMLTAASGKDFTISTKLSFTPKDDYQSAGLIIFGNDSTLFSLQRRHHSGLGGNVICGVNRSGSVASEPTVKDTAYGQPIFLKIEKKGTQLDGYWSVDGKKWDLVCSVTNQDLDLDNLKVGIYTGNGAMTSCPDITAVVQDFKMNNTLIPFAIENDN